MDELGRDTRLRPRQKRQHQWCYSLYECWADWMVLMAKELLSLGKIEVESETLRSGATYCGGCRPKEWRLRVWTWM
jgi:hypothetical protein